jgi:hypothetical protein
VDQQHLPYALGVKSLQQVDCLVLSCLGSAVPLRLLRADEVQALDNLPPSNTISVVSSSPTPSSPRPVTIWYQLA